MSGAVFRETFRRGWRAVLLWGIGVGLLAFVTIAAVPSVESLEQISNLVKTLPPALLKAFGGEDVTFMATPEGYLSLNLYSWLLLVFATYGILAGLNVTANEEERGIMDVMISLPLHRWRIVVEKSAAYALFVVGMVVLTLLWVLGAIAITPSMTVNVGRIVEATLNMIPGSVLVLCFTAWAATLVRRRNTAAGLAAAFLVFSYFIDLIGRAASGTVLDSLRAISFYTYYDGPGVMQNGLAWLNVIGLLLVSALLIGGAVWAFARRDVGI